MDSTAKSAEAQDCLLSPQEAAQFLGISRAQMYRLLQRREIPAFKISPQAIRVWKRELVAWLENNPYS